MDRPKQSVDGFRLIKVVLIGTIAAFATSALLVSIAVFKRQDALREVSRYNLVWAVSQALAEFHRFESRVAGFGAPEIDKDEVLLRYDILHNRLNIFTGGEVETFTEQRAELQGIVREFRTMLTEIEPQLAVLERGGSVQTLLSRLIPFEAKLSRLAAAANEYAGELVAADQARLLSLHWMFSGVSAALTFCGFAFILLLFLQNRLLSRAYAELRAVMADLRTAKVAAEAASEAKSRFLATMSHELKTPLNAVIGFSEIIAQEALGKIAQTKYRDFAKDILRSGRHMLELVGDILTMAKLEAGSYELNPEPADLRSVTERAVTLFRGTEHAKGRIITMEANAIWPVANIDDRAFRQMLLNLLSNAVKFSEADTPIDITCGAAADGEIRLTIADQGIGMTAQQTGEATQAFHQVDGNLSRKYEGAGLGLSIVAGLIECHGGRLTITSHPGMGTQVSLFFPPVPAEPVGALAPALTGA